MGSQSKKKKATKDQRNTISEIKRDIDQDTIRVALTPAMDINGFGSNNHAITEMRNHIDWVNITETIDPSQTPS